MDIKDLMNIDVDNLIEKQLNGLKQYTIERLEKVIELIKEDKYDSVKYMLADSPSGDAYGCDNCYINFAYDNNNRDINDILDELIMLKYKLN